MNITLFGNPNVGKTTVYNFLTGQRERTGNWHGVTVDAVTYQKGDLTVTDVPGLYSLSCTSPEEIASLNAIKQGETFVQVVSASTLSRSLKLTKEFAMQGKGVLLILTMLDGFTRHGGFLSVKGLEETLGVPIFIFTGRRKDKKELLEFLKRKPAVPKTFDLPPALYSVGEWNEGKLERVLYRPFFSISLFFVLLLGVFYLTFSSHSLGSFLKDLIESFFSFLASLVTGLPVPLERFICQGLVSIGSVFGFLPQIAILNAFLIFLEESGYLSILSFVSDDYLEKVGLTGRSVLSLLSGFGCTSIAYITTKTCSRDEQTHLFHLLPYVSCSAKMPVYLTLFSSFFAHPFLPVTALYFLGILIGFLSANPCPCHTLPSEVAHFELPNAKNYLKSLFFSCKSFIIKVGTVVLAFLLVSWFFSSYSFSMEYDEQHSMLSVLCQKLSFLLKPMGIDDWRYVYALLSGLIAKENVAGILTMYFENGLTIAFPSALSFAICILTTSPCLSAVVTNASIVGYRKAFLASFLQSVLGLLYGYLTYALCHRPYLIFILLAGITLEKIYRHRRTKLKKLYG